MWFNNVDVIICKVCKLGSVTGFTSVTFKAIRSGLEFNFNKPTAVVSWTNEDDKFADNGDYGAIYFYKHNGRLIPFAVHVGRAKKGFGYVSLGAILQHEATFDYIVWISIWKCIRTSLNLSIRMLLISKYYSIISYKTCNNFKCRQFWTNWWVLGSKVQVMKSSYVVLCSLYNLLFLSHSYYQKFHFMLIIF